MSCIPLCIDADCTPMSCPCVSKGQKCACTACGQECRCVEEYATQGTVPEQCPCPKTPVDPKKNVPIDHPQKKYSHTSSAHIAISYGELFDKITILEIKEEQITDAQKLEHIRFELETLNKSLNIILVKSEDRDTLCELKAQLKKLNWQLWQAEDAIRAKEGQLSFDEEFITFARNIYTFNDARAAVKRKISELLHSRIIEEKSYVIQP